MSVETAIIVGTTGISFLFVQLSLNKIEHGLFQNKYFKVLFFYLALLMITATTNLSVQLLEANSVSGSLQGLIDVMDALNAVMIGIDALFLILFITHLMSFVIPFNTWARKAVGSVNR